MLEGASVVVGFYIRALNVPDHVWCLAVIALRVIIIICADSFTLNFTFHLTKSV